MTINFNIRAIDINENLIYGINKINTREKISKTNSLCELFELDKRSGMLYTYPDSLFFYGHEEELSKHYYLNKIPKEINLEEFKVEKKYAKIGLSKRWYSIPLENMILGHVEYELLENIREKNNILLDMIKNMVKIKVKSKKEINHAKRTLFSFPKKIEEIAIKKNSFYRSLIYMEKVPERRLTLLKLEIKCELKEGLPVWFDEYRI